MAVLVFRHTVDCLQELHQRRHGRSGRGTEWGPGEGFGEPPLPPQGDNWSRERAHSGLSFPCAAEGLKHLHKVEMRFYCPQMFLSVDI